MNVDDRRYKCCGNCFWCRIDPYDQGKRCCNGESRYCTEWVSEEHKCEKHKWVEDN